MAANDPSTASLAPILPEVRRGSIARYGLYLLLGLLLLGWPLIWSEQFLLHIGTMVCLQGTAACSLHLIIRTGHVSLGHAAFLGVGAYTCVYLVMQLGVPFALAVAVGALAAGALALAIGPVILRLTGKYFVLITFLLGEIMRMVFVDWRAVTGGANGIFDIPPPAPAFASTLNYYYLALAMAALCVGICARMLTSEIGRAIDSIREGDKLAECAGIPVIRYKVLVFVIACTMAGFVGGFLAHYARYVSPQAFGIIESLNLVIMNVIGGMNSLVGPIVGAAFLVITPELLRGYVELQQIIFGAILIVVMAFLPGGLVGLGEQARAALARLLGRSGP